MLGAYYHSFDPVIVHLFGDFAVRWYGLAYLAGFLAAYLLLRRLSAVGWLSIPGDRIADALMWMIGGVLVGGRLGYLLVYEPSLMVKFQGAFPFWGGLMINRGGMASHGGLAGVILAAWRISRGWKKARGEVEGRCSIWHVFDAMALVCPAGLGLGRLANFINGELLGKVHTPATVDGGPAGGGPWWTVRFPGELLERPRELSEAQVAGMEQLVRRVAPDMDPDQGWRWVVSRAERFEAELAPILTSRHPSQLYQAAAEGVVLGLVLWGIWWWQRRRGAERAGLIGCAFMVVYGALRIATEHWRLPDAQFGDAGRIYGLSRGQWLSVVMIVVGAAAGAIRLRRTGAADRA